NYFVAQYGYQPKPFELLKAAEELPKFSVDSDFLSTVVSRDGSVKMSGNPGHSSHNNEQQFDPHKAFVVYVRTTSAAKDLRDPFLSILLLGVNLPNIYGATASGNASATDRASIEEELEQELAKHNMSLQFAKGRVASFLGTYELLFWKKTSHRSFLEKAAGHLELGIENGYRTPENVSFAAEALFRLGVETLEDKDGSYEERLKTSIELLSRSEAYVTICLSLGKTGLHNFISAAQVYLQLIRANYLSGTTLQELHAYTTKFFDSSSKAISLLANSYEPKIAHILEHLLEEIHEIVSIERQGGKQLQRVNGLLRSNASNLQRLVTTRERDRPHQALDSILRQTFLNR
ncbi:MAG: hypothetical protein AABX60_02585, partial [Nanoarchaeota archaeon]